MESNGHVWRVIAQYDLTPDDALRLTMGYDDRPPSELMKGELPAPGDKRPILGLSNLRRDEMLVCCLRCELAFSVEVAEKECIGDPDSYAPDGTPLYGGKPIAQHAVSVGNIPPGRLGPLKRPGRNEPCPCGSGKKFKLCHGG